MDKHRQTDATDHPTHVSATKSDIGYTAATFHLATTDKLSPFYYSR